MAHRTGHRDDKLKVVSAAPQQRLRVTVARPQQGIRVGNKVTQQRTSIRPVQRTSPGNVRLSQRSTPQRFGDNLRTAGFGLRRSAIGFGQGLSGLVDLAPGTGTNRLSQKLDEIAKSTDRQARAISGDSNIYKGAQLVGDIAGLATGGGAIAKGLSALGRTSKGASAVGRASQAIDKLAKTGKTGSVAAKGIRIAGRPQVASDLALDITTGIGQKASKDEKITGTDILLNTLPGLGIGLGQDALARRLANRKADDALEVLNEAVKANQGAENLASRAVRQTEVPTGEVKTPRPVVGFSDDLRTRVADGKVDQQLKNVPIENLKRGEGVSGVKLNPTRVSKYLNDLRQGNPIDPIVVSRKGDDLFLEDGQHRLEAFKQAGIKDAPAVETIPDQTVKITQETPPETLRVAPTQLNEVPTRIQETEQLAAEQAPVASQGTSRVVPGNLTTPARAADTPKGRVTPIGESLEKFRVQKKTETDVKKEELKRISTKTGVSEDVLIREARRKGLTLSQIEAEAAQISDTNVTSKDAFLTSRLNEKYGPRGEKLNDGVSLTTDLEEQRLGQAISEGRGPIPEGVDPVTGEISGNPSDVDVRLQSVIDSVTNEVQDMDRQIAQAGMDGNDIRRKMQLAERGEYELTPREEQAADFITNRLNQARQTLEDAGIAFDGVRLYYTPQARQGESLLPRSREDLLDFGYSKHRTNALEVDEMNHGIDPMVDYIVRAENRELLTEKIVTDAAKIDNRPITPESAKQAAKKLEETKKKINDKAQSEGVLKNDTLSDFNEVGQLEGYEQNVIDFEPGAISQEPKDMMERAKFEDGTTIWESGFMQYDNSRGYASEYVRLAEQNGVSQAEVRETLGEYIADIMPNAEDSAILAATDYVDRVMTNRNLSLSESVNLVDRAIKNVSKAEIVKLAKSTTFTGNKMRKVVNEQINGRLLEDAYKQNFLQNLDRWLAERINVSLRGANVVSALFELGDIANIGAKYGYRDMPKAKFGLGKIDGDRFALSNKYGENNPHFISEDLPEVSKFDEIWSNDRLNLAQKITRTYKAGENKLLAFRYVEQMKTELFFRQADDFYRNKGLRGKELVEAVMEDYHNTMLPTKLATANRILGKMPRSLTQYLNWGLQATKRMGRTLSGTDAGGKFADMTTAGRVARGVSAEIAPKVIAATVLGVPIMQLLGIRDFTGTTEGDFTGISDEDKEFLDHVVSYTSLSPILGLASEFYFANRRNEIARERAAAGETFRAQERPEDTLRSVAGRAGEMIVPFKTQFNKTKQVLDATPVQLPDVITPEVEIFGQKFGGDNLTGENRGFYINRDGRIQAEGPSGLELLQGAVAGKTYTPTFREFQDNPDILKVISGEAEPLDLITKNQTISNIAQTFGGRTRDFQRPLSSDITDDDGNQVLPGYNSKAKEAISAAEKRFGKGSPQTQQVVRDWIEDGRAYNALYDDLTRNKPEVFEKWLQVRGEDVLTPEKWRVYQGDSRLFEYDKSRKLMEAKHLGRDIDPIYELPNEQAKMVLQERSAYTGDDMRQRTFLYQTDWYNDFKDAESDYYSGFKSTFDTSDKSPRYKEWRRLSDLAFSPDSELLAKHPLVSQNKAIIEKYGFDSDESNAWFKANVDEYLKQKDSYDTERLNIINQMRKLEGVEPLTKKQFEAKIEFEDDDTAGGSSNGFGTGSKGVTIRSPKVRLSGKAFATPTVKLKSKSTKGGEKAILSKAKKVKVKSRKPSAGGKIKIREIK